MPEMNLSETGKSDPVAARQGSKQRLNLRVLTTSLVLILLVSAVLYGVFLSAPHSENLGSETSQPPVAPAAPAPLTPP
jgi:hypothetical protein